MCATPLAAAAVVNAIAVAVLEIAVPARLVLAVAEAVIVPPVQVIERLVAVKE
jgi:hypothetical protein